MIQDWGDVKKEIMSTSTDPLSPISDMVEGVSRDFIRVSLGILISDIVRDPLSSAICEDLG